MTDTASLVIKVDSSSAAKATDNLKNLASQSAKTEKSTDGLTKALQVAKGVFTAYAVQTATRYFIQQADAFANMSAKLKLVTGSTQAATKAQKDLFDLSQRTSSDLESTTDLYVKLGQSSKELAGNHALLLGITEKVSKALVISGADAASSAAVIRQFSQAMASGALRGDEFISVMEGAPRLARAIADGLNVPIGALRKFAAEGKLTSDAVIGALEKQGAVIDREFGEMPLTVSRATQQVRNALLQLIGDTDKTAGASKDLANAIADMARVLESEETKRGFAAIVSGIASIIDAAGKAIPVLTDLFNAQQKAFGFKANSLGNGRRAPEARDQIQGLGAAYGSLAEGDIRGFSAGMVRSTQAAYGIGTLADFSGVTAEVGGRRQRNVRGGSNRTETGGAASAYSGGATADPKATAGIRDRAKATQELTAEEKAWAAWQDEMTDIQEVWNDGEREAIQLTQGKQDAIEENRKAIDGMIGDMEFELSLVGMTNKEREREIALRYAGADATEAQRQKIVGLTEATYEAREATGKQIELMDTVRDAGSDIFVDWVGGTKSFKDAALDAFESIRQKILQMIAENLMDQLFGKRGDPAGGSTGGFDWGGLIGSFFGGGGSGGTTGSVADLFDGQNLFSGGGYTGPGGKHQFAGAVHKGEVVFSQDDVSRAGGVGAVEAMRKGGGGSNVTNITVNVPRDYSFRTGDQVAQSVAAKQQSVMRRSS